MAINLFVYGGNSKIMITFAWLMIQHISDNIISPLGFTSEDNYIEVKAGHSRLKRYEGKWGIPEAFTASLFSDEEWGQIMVNGYSRYESILIRSIKASAEKSGIDLKSDRVLFVFSSAKGNIGDEDSELGKSARRVTEFFGNENTPVSVDNACISGLSAQITAKRALEAGHYDYALVAGAEIQSKFIVSGFQSFKSVSADECRPFDIERIGLNLGEAAASIIYKRCNEIEEGEWYAVQGAVRNDAYHISSPSKKGDGSYRCLRIVLDGIDKDSLALLSLHGTSTMYNDEMEAVTINRAGLQDVPVNSLKGYFGHTMGAAGVLEAILSMKQIDDHTILGTRGFEEMGVSKRVNISAGNRATDKKSFVKMLSGFGGCNAAMYFRKG